VGGSGGGCAAGVGGGGVVVRQVWCSQRAAWCGGMYPGLHKSQNVHPDQTSPVSCVVVCGGWGSGVHAIRQQNAHVVKGVVVETTKVAVRVQREYPERS